MLWMNTIIKQIESVSGSSNAINTLTLELNHTTNLNISISRGDQ